MEHVLHVFGGGCGEHFIWLWLAPIGLAIKMYWLKLFGSKQ